MVILNSMEKEKSCNCQSLNKFLLEYEMLRSFKFGIREGPSTVQATAKVIEDIVEGLEGGEHVVLILL